MADGEFTIDEDGYFFIDDDGYWDICESCCATDSYPYKNCATDAVVARFSLGNLPEEFVWVDVGSPTFDLIACYRDTATGDAATVPVPCTRTDETIPAANCGALAATDFTESFDSYADGSPLPCEFEDVSGGQILPHGTVQITSSKAAYAVATGSATRYARSQHRKRWAGDFDINVELDWTGLDAALPPFSAGVWASLEVSEKLGSNSRYVQAEKSAWDGPNETQYRFGVEPGTTITGAATPGTVNLRIKRVGSVITAYFGAISQVLTPYAFELWVTLSVVSQGAAVPAISATFDDFTVTSGDI